MPIFDIKKTVNNDVKNLNAKLIRRKEWMMFHESRNGVLSSASLHSSLIGDLIGICSLLMT